MAERLGFGNEVRELKIGQSFTNPKSTAFHTVKYDFKPASVDTSKKATVDIGENHQVTVTVPHSDGAGVPPTVFKGSQKPYQKECVLVINRVTGEITLEKLGYNIQVKKTRSEYNKSHFSYADRLSQSQQQSSTSSERPSPTPPPSTSSSARAQTPPMVASRVSNKTRVASGSRRAAEHRSQPPPSNATHSHHHQLVPKHSPLRASPSHNPSPGRYGGGGGGGTAAAGRPGGSPGKREQHHPSVAGSAISAGNNESHSQSTLASLPMIGIDDYSDLPMTNQQQIHQPTTASQQQQSLPTRPPSNNSNNHHQPVAASSRLDHPSPFSDHERNGGGVGEAAVVGTMSDSSSSSSDSDSDSDEDDSAVNNRTYGTTTAKTNGIVNGAAAKIESHLLNDDLCLSESGSESE